MMDFTDPLIYITNIAPFISIVTLIGQEMVVIIEDIAARKPVLPTVADKLYAAEKPAVNLEFVYSLLADTSISKQTFSGKIIH
jgi:hypothetical protein